MNDNAKKWVAALRSGEYKQTNYALHVPEDYTPAEDGSSGSSFGNLKPGYCCLGVACVLYQAEVGDLSVVHKPHTPVMYDHEQGGLPPKVCHWLGLKNSLGGTENTPSLVSKNDDEKLNFTEIADWIEATPELFEDNASA